jgi:hypothetical protein
LFYSDYNDINIFVEDEYKEFIYENIFQRMFNYQIRINKILPMKGKPGVEKAFQEYGCSYDGKPAIYLVDGDFDLVMGKEMIDSPNYIYLEKYNIESYYIDEKAVLKYMAGKMKITQKRVSEKIEYSEWEDMAYEAMKELFINYMVAQNLFPKEKNVGLPPHSYFYKNGYVNTEKIEEYINSLKCRIPDYDAKYDSYKRKFETILLGDITRLVCGKYLLASLSNYLREKANVTFKEDDFIYFLASFFDIKKLDYVKIRILSIISAGQV